MSQLTTGGCFKCIAENLRKGMSVARARQQGQHPIDELTPVGNIYLCSRHRPA